MGTFISLSKENPLLAILILQLSQTSTSWIHDGARGIELVKTMISHLIVAVETSKEIFEILSLTNAIYLLLLLSNKGKERE